MTGRGFWWSPLILWFVKTSANTQRKSSKRSPRQNEKSFKIRRISDRLEDLPKLAVIELTILEHWELHRSIHEQMTWNCKFIDQIQSGMMSFGQKSLKKLWNWVGYIRPEDQQMILCTSISKLESTRNFLERSHKITWLAAEEAQIPRLQAQQIELEIGKLIQSKFFIFSF